MKKFVSVFLAIMIILGMTSVVFAENSVDYEGIYTSYAIDAETNEEHPFCNTSVKGYITVDLNMDSVPELFTFSIGETRYDEEGNVLFEGDGEEKYNNPAYTKKSYSLVNGFYIENGVVKENSPWKKADGTNDIIGMSILPGEIPEMESEEFAGSLAGPGGSVYLSAYSTLFFPNFSAVTYTEEGFSYIRKDVSEIGENEFAYKDIPMASQLISEGENKYSDALNGLFGEYKNNLELKCSDWAKAEVLEAKEKNIIPPEMRYDDLKTEINRAEFAAIAVHLVQALSKEELNWHGGYISDIDNNIYSHYIRGAYVMGITSGTGTDSATGAAVFSPERNITREQIATMLCRAIKLKKFGDANSEEILDITGAPVFEDSSDVSDYAASAVSYMSKIGVIKGTDETHFSPKKYATKEQAVLLALRLINNKSEFIEETEEIPEVVTPGNEPVAADVNPLDVLGKSYEEVVGLKGGELTPWEENDSYLCYSDSLYLSFSEETGECVEVITVMGECFPKMGRKTYTVVGFNQLFDINAENLRWADGESSDEKICRFESDGLKFTIYADKYEKITADSQIEIMK